MRNADFRVRLHHGSAGQVVRQALVLSLAGKDAEAAAVLAEASMETGDRRGADAAAGEAEASFRSGPEVAVALDPGAGAPAAFDRAGGSVVVAPRA